MSSLVLLLALTGTIRVSVQGAATEVVAYYRGEAVARAPVAEGVAVLRDLAHAPVDIVALGDGVRSEIVRHVRTARGDSGFDVRLVARPAHRLTVQTEKGAQVHVGGIQFPAERVLLLPGLHRVVVDHPRFVSSAARLVRVDRDLPIDVALEAGLVVSGTVFGHDGKPLPGAKVEVFTDGYAAHRFARTAANGGFAVSGFRGDVVSLRIRAAGHAVRLVRVPFEPGSERTRLAVHLVRGVSVSLRIEGATGQVRATLLPDWFDRALEEPRLRVNDEPARATGRDRIAFDGLTPGDRYRILVECVGFLPAATAAFEAGVAEALPVLSPTRGASIRGRLKGPKLPERWGGVVVARGGFGDRISRLDRNHAFRFDGLPPGKVLLFLRDLDERGTVVKVEGRGEEELSLEYDVPSAERAIEGTVLDSDRKPLGGVLVASGYRRVVTDEEGRFRLEAMPFGRDRFSLDLAPTPASRAFRTAPHLPRVERKARLGIVVRAQLDRSGTLAVRWQQARLARATLYLAGTSGSSMRWRIPRGASGMTIGEIPVGSYVVEVAAPGYLGTGGAVAQVGSEAGESIDVPLLGGRSVSGRVVLRRGIFRAGRAPQLIDTPIRSGTVSLYDLAQRFALATAPLAEDGSFLLEGLPAAPVLIVAATPGLPVGALRVDLTRRAGENLVLPLFDPISGGVQVTGTGGIPIPDAHVVMQTAAGLDLRDLASRGRFLGVVADDHDRKDVRRLFDLHRKKDGSILYSLFAPGNYQIRVTAKGYKPGVARMRARTRWTVEQIGTMVHGLGPTSVIPLRLARVSLAPREENSGGD